MKRLLKYVLVSILAGMESRQVRLPGNHIKPNDNPCGLNLRYWEELFVRPNKSLFKNTSKIFKCQ
jgi:hypothetical protein